MFLHAYSVGAFPMADSPAPRARRGASERRIRWYSPDPRAIIELADGGLHVGRTIARHVRGRRFMLTSDRAFERVIRACAKPGPTRGGSWLEETLINCYTLLHERGYAHSIEAWSGRGMGLSAHVSGASPEVHVRRGGKGRGESRGEEHGQDAHATEEENGQDARGAELLGGIYGVSIGGAFFAESMFTAIDKGGSGASGVCLVAMWNHLRACGYELMDVQMANEHTRRFGVIEIPREEYLARLAVAIQGADRWRELEQ